ncbi:dihydrofolate reductase [Lichenihabitans sp. Uapishka_5]|uniref:dihydrofolate reductase n=1 Tax=Lichenihabitans sp. Uapishka_5 TaxID=3037302 RepID=UPI0029E82123|nr:dihydrofolate reductase [Lichenihabitans sp. Uapishka_5]MDX7950650.1 dihydrofolate reductase [Lichenihabitans sp. Uapishka_5]
MNPAAAASAPPLPRPLVLVAAVARNRIIGRDGTMPWHLPGDLAQFRVITLGHALLMGRKTFEAIGRPLPGRLSTVLTSRDGFAAPGVAVARSLPEAIAATDRQSALLNSAAVMVIGGGAVYAATIGLASRLLITEVDATPDGDARFPPIDTALWWRAETGPVTQGPDDQHAYRFTRWERRRPGVG